MHHIQYCTVFSGATRRAIRSSLLPSRLHLIKFLDLPANLRA